jgi:glycosyltransferase involved in cell wall biosynthesis
MSRPSSPLAITWVLATISGYGIYGLQIALQYLRRGGQQLILTRAPAVTTVPPLVFPKLEPIFELGKKLDKFLQENPNETLGFNHTVLHGCSSDLTGFPGQERIVGKPNVACCAIEHLFFTDHGRAMAPHYDMFIAISRWNEGWLKSLNLPGPTHLCYQGIDSTLFHPAPKSGLYGDRFVIFSGGKFEFRKGQDIVLAAFKKFHARHPEALLVTCWQNLLKPNGMAFELAGHIKTVPQPATDYGLAFTPWLLEQGLPEGSFIDLPFTHNLLMPWVLRECDVAIFPNRCEGGTNLVAMEAMACGVPTYVAYNSGQKDLVDLIGCGGFMTQRTVKSTPAMNTLQDWGETDVDEVIEKLEYVYTQREAAKRDAMKVAERVAAWEWGSLNEKFLRIVCDGETA